MCNELFSRAHRRLSVCSTRQYSTLPQMSGVCRIIESPREMLKQFLWDDLSCCAHITSRPHQSVRSGSHLGSRYQNRWFMNSLPGGLWDLLCSLHNEWCEQNVLRPKIQGCYIRTHLNCSFLSFINTKTHVFWGVSRGWCSIKLGVRGEKLTGSLCMCMWILQ